MNATVPFQSSERIFVIEPQRGWLDLALGELWRFHDLLWILAKRNIQIRYKQTLLGIGWAVIQPVTSMIIFSVIFGGFAKVPSDGLPYPVFAFAALVPWTYFASTFAAGSTSVSDHGYLITKVYFPRLILPLTPLLSGLLDFLIALCLLAAMMAWYGIVPTPAAAFIPLFVLLLMATSFTVSLWLSAMCAFFRDIKVLVPFLAQLWFFLTPIVYPTSIIPGPWRVFYALAYGISKS